MADNVADSEVNAWLVCATCEGKICTICGTADELRDRGYRCPDGKRVVRIIMEVA